MLWVYADARPGGTFERVGGGRYDPATNTYEQGAYDADDIARAAVVYLRQWRATGDRARERAGLSTTSRADLSADADRTEGRRGGAVDATGRQLNPSPTPVELPDPSDSDASYWLARTLWALGEGYAAFRDTDRGVRRVPAARMDLAVAALHRDVLARYGTYQIIHGVGCPTG